MYTPLYFNNYLEEQTVFSGLTLFISVLHPQGLKNITECKWQVNIWDNVEIILLAIAWLILVTSLLWEVINIFFILSHKVAQNVHPDNLKAIIAEVNIPWRLQMDSGHSTWNQQTGFFP